MVSPLGTAVERMRRAQGRGPAREPEGRVAKGEKPKEKGIEKGKESPREVRGFFCFLLYYASAFFVAGGRFSEIKLFYSACVFAFRMV